MRVAKKLAFLSVVFLGLGFSVINCSGGEKFKPAPKPFARSESDNQYIERYKKHARTYKIGKPYKILGQMFYPGHDPSYDETGIASWYGINVDTLTANGELFDIDEMAAAHPTLPLPSIVEVTNLDNGKKIILKVNDRGPFKHNRIIDLTQAAAREIGMLDSGVANVRVKYLKEETIDYLIYDH